MVPQSQAAVAKPRPRPAQAPADGRERRWPRFWTVFGALAASAALWVVIYLVIASGAGLVGGALR